MEWVEYNEIMFICLSASTVHITYLFIAVEEKLVKQTSEIIKYLDKKFENRFSLKKYMFIKINVLIE